MDSPNFSGLGIKLQRVLQALDINDLGLPSWNLKENKDSIYLDIRWFKSTATYVSSQHIEQYTTY
jgi:hypothetical protein